MNIQSEPFRANKNEQRTWRNSEQPLLPLHAPGQGQEAYSIYPLHALGDGILHSGYKELAAWIATKKIVLIDGSAGVFWDELRASLDKGLRALGKKVNWYAMTDWQKEEQEINRLIAPFAGEEGDVWGKRATLDLVDFFEPGKWALLPFAEDEGLHVVIGAGAALVHAQAPVIYCECSKTELQYRMRAGAVTNLGSSYAGSPAEMYKRFYFIDWVLLNHHKYGLRHRIEIMADVQWKDTLTWLFRTHLEQGLKQLVQAPFRVRPWFEAGAWGGQWMKEHLPGINREEVNYAWSFELIVPENGILLESDRLLFELPFEWMMYYQHQAILGRHAEIFGCEFPIRFDFLDTFDGGNLSIQCHPSLEYIREHFGETITQDETYYILDCKEDAGVYLGFQAGIDPAAFRTVLEESKDQGNPIDMEKYVQLHKAEKHDLFLIPNGTVHSAGANNMVLEISATPYIFTFKMYDWVRPGLDGKPRAINIEHAFHNLDFSRQGDAVKKQLISAPLLLGEGKDWQLKHLPTHADHFYDVHRIEFDTEIRFATDDCCLVMMLVEGSSISVTTANGTTTIYHYAETFVIPAAAITFQVRNLGEQRAKLIKAFIKKEHPIFNSLSRK